VAVDRDRDQAGRARNARPRDRLGRPLDREAAGEPTAPDQVLDPQATLTAAQHLIDEGKPFHAHEVLEARWHASPAAERDLWQGLAQLAVGLTHAMRGNATGAAALLRRGAERINGHPAAAGYRIDADGLSRAAESLAATIERGGLAAIGTPALRLQRDGDQAG
jgi:predicted metal-dependent hydrolase